MPYRHVKNQNLDTNWFIAKDAENIGKSSAWEKAIQPDAVPAYVPSIIQQFFPEYHGVAYYWCKFSSEVYIDISDAVLLKFGGADSFAEVWLNSEYLGSYEGGETPFSFDITDKLNKNGENLLAVRIINPTDKDIDGFNLMNTPHRNKIVGKRAGSCLNHGGLWYGVSITAVPLAYIEDKFVRGDIKTGEITATAYINSKNSASEGGTLMIRVYEHSSGAEVIAKNTVTVYPKEGKNENTVSVTVPGFKLWSCDDPHLYRVELTLSTEFGEHIVTQNFGFREFKTKDGFFYLNGKKIFLKSSHSGNAFPVGQMVDVIHEQLRQDFIYAKAAGFNMIRCIAGLFRPEQLDLADEIGLMIYDECFASWCLAYSHAEVWQNNEEFEQNVNIKHQNAPVGDEDTMLARWRSATENMILRDRNHPSVVIWGMLNETKNNSVFREAVAFLPRLRELDPTRLAVLSSGRWDNDFSIGSASNPYADKWENNWGIDGHPELFNGNNSKMSGDNHHYAAVPLSDEDVNFYRTEGTNSPLPHFQSEFGIGSMFHVIEEWKHFLQYGFRDDLEDASWLKYQSDKFTEDFYKFGVDKLFAFPESYLKESQRVNADERKRVYDILRSNPRMVGYSLTGLLDHGWCGEGLWSYFRRWKPEMFDAVSEGHARLRFSLFATPSSFVGDEITVEATLSNEGILKSGTYHADFAIIHDAGVVLTFSEEFDVSDNEFVSSIMKKSIRLDVPAGKYKLVASLREGSPAATETEFFIFDKLTDIHTNMPIYHIGVYRDFIPALKTLIPKIKDYNGESDGIIIVGGAVDESSASDIIEAARSGATVIFMDRDAFIEKNGSVLTSIDPELKLTNQRDWLYHNEFALLNKEVFSGIGDKLARLTKFGPVFSSHYSFTTKNTPDFIVCPGFKTGHYDVPMSYGSYHAILGYKVGAGKIYLNSFNLLRNQNHPIANIIIGNTVKYLDK